MSVCFFLPTEQGASSASDEAADGDTMVDESAGDSAQQTLQQFWTKVTEDIKSTTADDFKTQALPLARIKKIMKLDEEVRMISAEAPVLFAKAAEIFIHELTLRAWSHTEDNKRRTLQRNDIAMAISKSDQFDFLIDIVPRHESVVTKPRKDLPRAAHNTEQVCQRSPAAAQTQGGQQQQIILQSFPHLVQQQSTSGNQQQASATSQQQPVVLQQLVTPSSEMPLQLTQGQINAIRMQLQGNSNQPIIIQAQPINQQGQQIIQVSSQAQQPQQHQVYLQVATTREADT